MEIVLYRLHLLDRKGKPPTARLWLFVRNGYIAWRRRLILAQVRRGLDPRLLEDVGIEPPPSRGYLNYFLLWSNTR